MPFCAVKCKSIKWKCLTLNKLNFWKQILVRRKHQKSESGEMNREQTGITITVQRLMITYLKTVFAGNFAALNLAKFSLLTRFGRNPKAPLIFISPQFTQSSIFTNPFISPPLPPPPSRSSFPSVKAWNFFYRRINYFLW